MFRTVRTPYPDEVKNTKPEKGKLVFFTSEEVESFDPELCSAFMRYAEQTSDGFDFDVCRGSVVLPHIPSAVRSTALRRHSLRNA